MKARKITATVILVLLVAAILCACNLISGGGNSGTNGAKITVNIHMDTSYGYKATDFVDANGKLKIPTNDPVKEGYDFVCWALDEEGKTPIVKGTAAKEIVNVYPIFQKAVLDVKIFDEYNGNSIIKVEYGYKVEINPPEADGYEFNGWFGDSGRTIPFDLDTQIKEYTEIYVGWKLATYTIKYVLNGGEFDSAPTDKYIITDTIALAEPKKEGYDFDGWYENADFSGEGISVLDGASGNKTLYAKYICNLAEIGAKEGLSKKTGENEYVFYADYREHTVTITDYFEFSQNSTVISEMGGTALQGNKVTLEDNSGEGGVKTYSIKVKVTSESGGVTKEYTVVVCQYDETKIQVTYLVDGSAAHIANVARGEVIEAPFEYEGEKSGYDFAYWAKDGAEFDFSLPINENITLSAVFTAKEYDVIYKLGAADNDPENPTFYTIETTAALKNPVLPDGYTFYGWYLDKDYTQKFTSFEGLTEEKTLYARYTKADFWNFNATGTDTFEYKGTNYTGNVYEVSKDEYPRLLDYLIFNKTDCAIAVIDGDLSEVDNSFYTTPAREVEVDCSIGISYAGNRINIVLRNYTPEASRTTDGGTYSQIEFVKFAKSGTREADFADFAIEHVAATMNVRDTEQLYFALEKGYRPIIEAGTTAETVYTEMKNILRGIIGEEFTEKDKALAIAEYLIETVAYDNKALSMFEMGAAELKTYRCFYLEGAILDKVAVCDGISKAFGALCAIEGIKAIQVNGTHNGVNHAWNKVYLDLDGDGAREWSVVDCTSANTLSRTDESGVSGVEIINHSYIFTTDDMLVNKNTYVYDSEWAGKFVANKAYDVYKDAFIPGKETSFYATSAAEMTEIIKYYKSIYDKLETGEKLVVDFCAIKTLIQKGDGVATATVDAMHDAGFNETQISEMKMYISVGRDDGDGVFMFYLEKK